ncbi:hypothetical protein ACP70R_003292 [Stipagrostis hirtigluma subsp. patula]
MRTWLFRSSSAPPQHDDEEALVKPPPPTTTPRAAKEDVTGGNVDDGADQRQPTPPPAAAAAAAPSKAPWRPSWSSWSTTSRGVGLVLGGLVGVVALLLLLAGGTSSSWWRIHLDSSSFLFGGDGSSISHHGRGPPHHVASSTTNLIPIPLNCGNASSSAGTCRRRVVTAPSPSPSPSSSAVLASPSSEPPPSPPRCPEYFRYIHSDLAPWRETGITREAVERGRDRAAFRLVVVAGRAYVETYHRVFQTRDTFTQWGIAQLLARYPGRVPDLDLMFNCEDMPELRAADFPDPSAAPPLFRYCKDDATLDVVFPDWSFWGWPELNIRPWAPLLEEMAAEARRLPWPERKPYAHWKGNPGVSAARGDLLRCNVSEGRDWNARVFRQDWDAAINAGFKNSNLAKQCDYRYKIFVQGRSWSVSEKYILACDSPMLLAATPYRDFFSRGLVAGRHYWPLDRAGDCAAIKFAVDWGNAHPARARRMAGEGSGFAREEMSMDYVYDYMLHLLTEYAKLLRYKPTVPENAVELCPESVACPAQGRERQFMMESRERYVADYEPCTLPPPFTADELRDMARREEEVRRKVHKLMQEHGHR